LTRAADGHRVRLLGFARVQLQPGESRRVTLTADPRFVARFDGTAEQWRITGGTYQVAVGRSADSFELVAETSLTDALFGS
ncbi:fibronectin type III-like domain-contianing protein, partial (plasmid) [Georgenia sp. TF02-10]|uniref:fibronectin type III-like domain-contianing protein n=1 Tax=Georgenia sp. TF02-10 TaxID=2917725 RepID=UPI001FA79981